MANRRLDLTNVNKVMERIAMKVINIISCIMIVAGVYIEGIAKYINQQPFDMKAIASSIIAFAIWRTLAQFMVRWIMGDNRSGND